MNRIAQFFRDYALARFLLPLGIILVVFGVVVLNTINRSSGFTQTEATVSKAELFEDEHYEDGSKVDATYTVFIKYIVDGKEYETEYGIFSGMKVGDPVTVMVNPADPTDVVTKNSPWLAVGLMAGGAVVLAIAAFSIVKTAKRNKALKLQEGEWING